MRSWGLDRGCGEAAKQITREIIAVCEFAFWFQLHLQHYLISKTGQTEGVSRLGKYNIWETFRHGRIAFLSICNINLQITF